MKIILVLLWVGVMISSAIGVFVIIGGMASAKTAIQESVVVAFGIAFAVIPYCFTRALEGINKADK